MSAGSGGVGATAPDGAVREPDWGKVGGLMPAVIQDADTGAVLMLGYMSPEALARTRAEGRVTFWSRSKRRLWTKGETSGNFLHVEAIALDCDADTLLILARPQGPACHLGTTTCFGVDAPRPAVGEIAFLARLDAVIADRLANPRAGSYTARLAEAGTRRVAQKVGEEGVELALAAVAQDEDAVLGEAADLLYHMTLLLELRGLTLADVAGELERRHQARDVPKTR